MDTSAKIMLECQFCLTWNRVEASRSGDRPKCGKCGKPMLLDRPVQLTAGSFERTIAGSDVPVFVDFYADWCGPCKMMAPAVDEIAREFQGRALVTKLNTDTAPEVSQRFNIRGIPTSIVFVGGKEAARESGALPKAGLVKLLERALPVNGEKPYRGKDQKRPGTTT
jgi:thioredoxin 2